MSSPITPAFVMTKEYRRFAEFCDACRRYRYIGLCYGPPGVGKTLSARYYANWDKVERYRPFQLNSPVALEEVLGSNTLFYTPCIANSPGRIAKDIGHWRADMRLHIWEQDLRAAGDVEADKKSNRFEVRGNSWLEPEEGGNNAPRQSAHPRAREIAQIEDPTTLILVDEADRLKMAGLEQMRDIFDQGGVGLVLIGMPGLEKRLSRYAQLYSRVGFIHAFRPLSADEMRHLLREKWREMGCAFTEGDFTDEEALTAVIRVTGGNFRLLHRLLAQMERILQINELKTITREVVEAAQEGLVIGNI
jgi:DNA transposition AAA+ family ATPase